VSIRFLEPISSQVDMPHKVCDAWRCHTYGYLSSEKNAVRWLVLISRHLRVITKGRTDVSIKYQPPILQQLYNLYRSTCVSRHLRLRTGGFSWCKVLLPACPCCGNQHIWIREKTLEFSSAVFYRAMLCIRGTSHGPVSACVCVCHKSEFY